MGEAHEKRLLHPSSVRGGRRKKSKREKEKSEKKKERKKEKAAVNRGEERGAKEGMERERRGKRVGVCAVRNADPFPRWPRWTISLPTAGPKNHNVPRLSLFPTLSSAGPDPRIHNVSRDRNPLACIYSYSQMKQQHRMHAEQKYQILHFSWSVSNK